MKKDIPKLSAELVRAQEAARRAEAAYYKQNAEVRARESLARAIVEQLARALVYLHDVLGVPLVSTNATDLRDEPSLYSSVLFDDARIEIGLDRSASANPYALAEAGLGITLEAFSEEEVEDESVALYELSVSCDTYSAVFALVRPFNAYSDRAPVLYVESAGDFSLEWLKQAANAFENIGSLSARVRDFDARVAEDARTWNRYTRTLLADSVEDLIDRGE